MKGLMETGNVEQESNTRHCEGGEPTTHGEQHRAMILPLGVLLEQRINVIGIKHSPQYHAAYFRG
jgi:hypothetical protein